MVTHFFFLFPWGLLLGLVPLVLIGIFALARKKPAFAIHFRLPDPIFEKLSRRTRRKLFAVYSVWSLGVIFLALAIARPVQVESGATRKSEGIDIVLVVDLSESMEATDFTPNRMFVARDVLKDFIERRPEDRIGLVAFGGEAVLKAPLTRDHEFLLSQVARLQTGELKQGTAIGMGLANAVTRLRKSQAKSKVIVLLTDGDSNVGAINPMTASALAKQESIRIYSIGIGKENRVLVPIFARDPEGRKGPVIAQVPSYLNPDLLRDISNLTGGVAYMARDGGGLSLILQEIDHLEKTSIQWQAFERKHELFFIPLVLGAILLLLAYLWMGLRFYSPRESYVPAL